MSFNIGDRVAIYGHTSELCILAGRVYAAYSSLGARGTISWITGDGEISVRLDSKPIEVSVHARQLVRLVKRNNKKGRGKKR